MTTKAEIEQAIEDADATLIDADVSTDVLRDLTKKVLTIVLRHEAVERYLESLTFHRRVPDEAVTLVKGNIRAFASQTLAAIREQATHD